MTKTTFTLLDDKSNKIEDFVVGASIRDYAAGIPGTPGRVLGYPVEGGYNPDEVGIKIDHDTLEQQEKYPCVITRTEDGKYHVRSIYCQELVK